MTNSNNLELTLYAGTDKFRIDQESQSLNASLKKIDAVYSLESDNIIGTTQEVTYDSSGNVSSVLHKKSGTTIRTDTFTFGDHTITEVRTLSSGQSLTIVTDTDTLITTTTYAAA